MLSASKVVNEIMQHNCFMLRCVSKLLTNNHITDVEDGNNESYYLHFAKDDKCKKQVVIK